MKLNFKTFLVVVMLLLLGTFAKAQTPATISGTVAVNSQSCSGLGSLSVNLTAGATPYNLVNSDLSSLPLGAVVGGVNWTPTFTSGNPHYLQLTPPNNDKKGFISFATTALKPVAFTANFGLYVGNGNGADGTSFNYGKVNTSSGNYGEFGMLDSGLAIGFNDYSNKIIIYYNQVQLTTYNVSGTLNNSNWKSVSISVNTSGQLTIAHGGTTYCTNYQLPAAYLTDNKNNWQYGFAARCGGLNNLHAVNDVVIKDYTPMQYSVDGTNYFTNNSFSLAPGTYTAYARIGDNAYNANYNTTVNLGAHTIASGITATLSSTSPTSCAAQPTGTITISNVATNLLTLVPYDLINLSLTNNQLGGASVGGLGTSFTPYFGVNNLVLTNATNSIAGYIDFGNIVAQPNAFSASFDMFFGGGSGADGMSFNYGNLNTAGTAGTTAEEGMVNSGLAIGFNEHNNTIKIYYNKTVVQTYSVSVLQANYYKSVSVIVTQDGKLTLVYGGTTICSNYQLPAAYATDNKSSWHYAMAARCGGLNNNHIIRNVIIKDNEIQKIQYLISTSSIRSAADIWSTDTTFTGIALGQYTVYARIGNGNNCSLVNTLGTETITAPGSVAITGQPDTTTRSLKLNAVATTLSVTATGAGTLGYQWYSNTTASNTGGNAIIGATNASFTPPTSAEGTLYYYCAVSNACSQVSSAVSGSITIKTIFSESCIQAISAGNNNTIGIKTDGTLWAWGDNQFGRLGDGTVTEYAWMTGQSIDNNKKNPVKIGTASNWASIMTGGDHTIAIKTDGTLWAWGYNGSGQLGDGTNTQRNSPVQIGTATNWASISQLGSHTVAIKTDGTLWAWGSNAQGQLGDGTTTNRNSPVQIGTATNWKSIGAGSGHTMAIKTNGTLWAWGYNGSGQLGDGTNTNRNSPVQIGTATNWARISVGNSTTIAIKTDGTLWAWGYNGSGQVGDGTTTNRNSPVQIGTANNWASISAGTLHTTAIKTDGTLWAWGNNSSGQLGDGTTTQKNSPVQIGTANNWASISSGNYHTTAIKTDGSLWAWGSNQYGGLGDGTTANKTSPVQISSCFVCTPTASTFTATACGSYTWVAKGNKVYTASNNTDTIHLTNAAGCDSVVTLNLTITQAPTAFSYRINNVFTQNSSITPLSPSNVVSTITSGYDPYGVAVDTAGNVFVSDYSNYEIKKIDKNGNETTFYSTGIKKARGLATDKAGNVYVTNQYYNTVLKISPNGTLLNTYTGFNNPRAVAVDAAGNIYVTDNSNNQVKKINTSGTITVIGSGFVYPYAIAVDATGNIYVADYSGNSFHGKLKKMDTSGVISVLATGFDDCSSIAVDANDNVYVADGSFSNGVIKVVAPNGNISSIGSGFSKPTGVALDAAGNVYVADDNNYEVYKIDMSGGAVSSYSVTPSLPAGLSLNTTTGVISGTPTVASFAGVFMVTAHNCAGNTSAIVQINVVCTPTTSSNSIAVNASQLPYSWNGLTFTVAGTQTAHLTNAAGCDSAATLTLNVTAVSAKLNLTAYLQGLYLGSGVMTAAPFNADGVSSPTVADTITVELRNPDYSLAYSVSDTLSTTGQASLTFPGSAVGNKYYVVIKHRNSIETWSSDSILIGSTTSYNFSSGVSQAFGDNMVDDGSGVYLIYGGDINQDGSVDFGDYPDLDLGSSNSDVGYFATDLNGDSSVDFGDYPMLDINSSNSKVSFHP